MKKILVFLFFAFAANAQLKLAGIFGDHMVLQQNKPIPVWGYNTPNEKVAVTFKGKRYEALANASGKWTVNLEMQSAGGPFELQVTDTDERMVLKDVYLGEVWLCSGQSNMEWRLDRADNAKQEIANARYPLIRQIEIKKDLAFEPKEDILETNWQVCTPENAGSFSAVAYFFARKIQEDLQVPVGIVHSSWGGSHVETWTSKSAMLGSDVLSGYAEKMPMNMEESGAKLEKLTIKKFHGSANYNISALDEHAYTKPGFVPKNWLSFSPIGQMDWRGVPSFRGYAWSWKEIELNEKVDVSTYGLSLGSFEGSLEVFINGITVFKGRVKDKVEVITESSVWKLGKNSLLIKHGPNVQNNYERMGFNGSFSLGMGSIEIPIPNENWFTTVSWDSPRKYAPWMNAEGTLCYNAMIAPLVPFAIKGALWYQGESNAGRANDYRKAFPLMIQDWRNQWKEEFPFYWVQLSSFGPFNDSNTGSNWAELREAQTMTLGLPNTGEAITTDIGNPYDIHPTNKQDVGLRLALNALQNTYGKAVVGRSPLYTSMKVSKNAALVEFSHVGKGLKTSNKYGYVEGFEIAGADRKFYFAQAEIVAPNQVKVSHPKVLKPVSVRYGWSNSPVETSVYNSADLPLTPFRTDTWPGVTEGVHFE